MVAESDNKCHLLADKIAELLRNGIQAGPDVIDYINSTYGNPGVEEIKALIDQQGGSERETLVELLFFPDESLQLQLEEALQAHGYTTEDAATVAADLASRNLRAAVSLGDTGRTLNVRVDRGVVDPFLTRLNIDYTTDADLRRTSAEVFPADRRTKIGVRIRNARTRPAGRLLDFFLRYIRAMHADRFFFEDLDFLLAFMQAMDGDADVYESLTKEKRKCRRHLNKIESVENKLRKTNVETLLLQGGRYPYIDRNRTMKTIAAIDRICLAVFGKTESIELTGRDPWRPVLFPVAATLKPGEQDEKMRTCLQPAAGRFRRSR